RTKPLSGRPTIPRSLRGRARVRTLRNGGARAPLLNEAAIFVPAFEGVERVSLEAGAAGAAIVSPPGLREQPELAAAAIARLAEDDDYRAGLSEQVRAEAESQSFAAVASELAGISRSLAARRRRGSETRRP